MKYVRNSQVIVYPLPLPILEVVAAIHNFVWKPEKNMEVDKW
jgi:hypothetical protein